MNTMSAPLSSAFMLSYSSSADCAAELRVGAGAKAAGHVGPRL